MSSYLDKTGLERVWSKAKDKFATVATTDELKGNIEILTSEKADKNEVQAAVANLIDSAPDTLNTLNELAAALGDNPNFATTVSAEIGKKVNSSEYNDTIGSINSQISAINGEIDSLQEASEQHLNKTDYLGPVVLKGNPITYDNGVEGFDIKVETTFGPTQSGSGDPYPAGGGRNKLVFNSTGRTMNGVEFITNPADGSVTVKGTTNASNTFANLNYVNGTTSLLPPGNYIVSGGTEKVRVEVIVNDSVAYRSIGNHVNFTIPENVTNSWVRVQIDATGTQVDTVLYPMVRLATDTDESYAPPSNIRSITGYDALGLTHAGKNLAPHFASETKNGVTLTVYDDGSVSLSGTYESTFGFISMYDVPLPPGTYTISANNPEPAADQGLFIAIYDETSTIIQAINMLEANRVYKLTTERSIKQIRIRGPVGLKVDNFIIKLQVERDSTATEFVKPQNKTYALRFDQTVYGGRFDWLTGKLVAEWGFVELGGNTQFDSANTMLYPNGERIRLTYNLPSPGRDSAYELQLLCNQIVNSYSIGGWNQGPVDNVWILSGYPSTLVMALPVSVFGTTEASVKAKLAETPLQVVYKLAAPIEIQLTPTQISELEGINTLYGDGSNIRAIFNTTGSASPILESIFGILPVEKGGTGAASPSGARNNLGITPANIGAVSKSGDTMTGDLKIGTIDSTSGYYLRMQRAVGDTYYVSRFYTHGETGAASIQAMKGSSAVNYMYLEEGRTVFKQPVNIGSGGTGATDAATARTNLNVPSRTGSGASGDWGINITGNAATATALTTSAGSSSQPIYFSNGKPVQVNNVWIGSATDTTGRSFDIKRKNSSDASYGRLNIGMSSTGNTGFIEYLHYDTSGTEDQDNLLYISRNSFYPNANTTNLGTSSKNWGTVYATSFSGSGASLTSLNASNISSGTLAIARGGTGATDAETARSNLGITPANIGAAPKSHASTATTYGAASASNYGHAMASSTTPKANGTAAVGSETAKFARGDHVHPLQTSVSGSSGSCTGNAASASQIAVTNTTPSNATTYYPMYVTGTSGNQTARVNTDFYYYDIGTTSYLNVGSSSHVGAITLHHSNGYYSNIIPDTSLSANRELKLPNASGTILTTGNYPALTSCTGTLTVAKGGTGATSKSGARTNLGIKSGTSLPSSADAGDIFFLYS